MNTYIRQFLPALPLAVFFTLSSARASDSVKSEASHFAGNLAIASVTTIAVDKLLPEAKHPAWTGFAVSAAEAIAGEAIDRASGREFSLLDAVAGTLGAAVGAYATDKWYIIPKSETLNSHSTYGLLVVHHF